MVNPLQTRRGRLLLVVLILAISSTAAWIALRPLPAPQASDAWAFCQRVILAELPAPQTAIFDAFGAQKVTADSETVYRVMLSLDTEDSAGRMVHLNAVCRLDWDGAVFDLLGLQMR